MVKVHKPIPKTIKKGGPELQKIQTKIVKTNSAKEVVKNVKKTLGAKNGKTKGPIPNKESNELLEKINETVSKKKPIVQKSLKNGDVKKPPALQEVVKKTDPKKKSAVSKKQQPLNNVILKQSALEEKNKKKTVEAKMQQMAKNPVANKNSLVGADSEKEKVVSKKKQVALKVKQSVDVKVEQKPKKPVDKKKIVVQKKAKEDKEESSQKRLVVAKEQQPLKKSVVKKSVHLVEESKTVKNVIPKAKVSTEKGSGKKALASEVQNKVGKPGQKKLSSKVQKKLSVEKKNQINLKSKVQKNIREVKKTLKEDKDEIIKSEEENSPLFEQENFDEDKFKDIVSFDKIKKMGEALNAVVAREVAEKQTVFIDYKYFLNIACYKIPNCPKRMVKLDLKHALVDTDVDDVVLIVPDLQRGAKVDYEPTIQHYEDMLRQNGVENIKVLPFNQLRTEYSSFEAKRKLSNRYDHYLCDGRIVGHVLGFCGKNFQKPRTTLHAVNLSNPKIFKQVIERALKRTSYRQLQRGDLSSVLVGNHRHTADQLAENIVKVIDQLKALYPGGYANMRNIHIRTDIRGTSSVPLYVSLSGAPEEVPNIIGPREQRMLKLKKQANEILSKFNLSKSGDIVKLNKTQVKRKQEIRETREALTSKKNVEGDEEVSDVGFPLLKKAKIQDELQNTDNSETSDVNDVDVSEEDDEESGEVSEDDGVVSQGESDENDEDAEVSEVESEENDDDGEDSSE